MTGFVHHRVPAEIAVFAGKVASQPLVFAHLADRAPGLDLDHVVVIQDPDPMPRLAAHFAPKTGAEIIATRGAADTLVLVLPAAYEGLICPELGTGPLSPLGVFRGTISRLIAKEDPPRC